MTEPKSFSPMTLRYSVRESRKAKNVSLKISWQKGLEVTIPEGFNPNQIPEILRQKQSWIEKSTQRIEAQRKLFEPESPNALPERICLRAIAEEWRVNYCATDGSKIAVCEKVGSQLTVSGAIEEGDRVKAALYKWLALKAKGHLVPWLHQVSETCALPFERTSIRGQKTRWASCSRHSTISLNYKLLFLPPSLVHYVFVHELCHTVHLNHSAKFWALVKRKQANYKQLDTELRDALCYVPAWVE